jgi:hypothetical protein
MATVVESAEKILGPYHPFTTDNRSYLIAWQASLPGQNGPKQVKNATS